MAIMEKQILSAGYWRHRVLHLPLRVKVNRLCEADYKGNVSKGRSSILMEVEAISRKVRVFELTVLIRV
ncbi:hypothetical protein VNO78_23273 [Psophocarpus tetragonolobus]|uniref:Uncharacterized protein n=1 Tax=Psophocarpus tetragonolobus TaxID=3891 RepID=A0AAN9S3H4_PSOTE